MLIKKCKHLIEVVNNPSQALFIWQMRNSSTPKRLQQPPLLRHATYSIAKVFGSISIALSLLLLLLLPFNSVGAVGYSYTRFVGPVAGPERKIFVTDGISSNAGNTQTSGSGTPHFDYDAKPEYEFAYGVEDADTHILHNRNEMRDGDAVKGVYSLIDPDGTLRVVKYTADEINGFQAQVIRNGVSSLHGQLQHDYIRAPPSQPIYSNYYNPNYNTQTQAPQAHLKGDTIVYYPSSNSYKSNVVQLPPRNHETPSQLPIIYEYHYNKNNDNDDRDGGKHGAGDGHRDYVGRGKGSKDQQAHYEVHEKPDDESQENQDQRPQYKVHEKPDEDSQENQGGDDGSVDNQEKQHDDDMPYKDMQKKQGDEDMPDKDRQKKQNDDDMSDKDTQKKQNDDNMSDKDTQKKQSDDDMSNKDKQKKQDDNDIGYKSNNDVKVTRHKMKKQPIVDEYDYDDDENYDYVNDSEEMDDYDEAVHATYNSEESYEYY